MGAANLPCLLRATSRIVHVRLHGPDQQHLYGGSYSDDDLAWWADRIREWEAEWTRGLRLRQHDGSPGAPSSRTAQYLPLITKNEPRIVPASFDFWRANLNRVASSSGTSIPSESLNPTARLPGCAIVYITLIERPDS